MCGGTLHFYLRGIDECGLSPRVRGNLRPDHHAGDGIGSIPACAGEPALVAADGRRRSVYPRVCGEPPRPAPSPRRGEVYPRVCGEPPGRGRKPRAGRVYPRVCGGTRAQLRAGDAPPGLSPRVRGNLHKGASPGTETRSIPACAGEPFRRPTHAPRCRVYPRVCGGTLLGSTAGGRPSGLSPRVRGNRRRTTHCRRRCGSIPACAGEPTPSRGAGCCWRVYPRVCGGTSLCAVKMPSGWGLSPRVRGNRRKVKAYE